MEYPSTIMAGFPPEQQAIRAKCFHPTGTFIEFKKEEIEQSIPDRFEGQVRKFPNRLAVSDRNGRLNYSELNQAANQVAHAILTQRGEGQEPVALLFEHGAPAIVAILGILKAGKFYVPLDPSFPSQRSSYVLGDCQARLIVTNNRNLSSARELAHNSCQLINIDESDYSLSTENPGLSYTADSLACIIFTSGSTGQPKGVLQNHRNVLHDVMNYTNDFHICSEDRISLLSPYATLVGITHTFGTLLSGAALFPFDLKQEDVGGLGNWLTQEEITFCYMVPTGFRQLIPNRSHHNKFPKLRVINLGGEPVSRKDLEVYREYFSPSCVFVNGFGTTETGVCRRFFVNELDQLIGSMVPVGYPVTDMETVLLDEVGNKVGFNQTGEISVQSPYLALGYWRTPELTKTAFISDLEITGGLRRSYRTGDLARMQPDGCLIHLGRKDFQVKVRGYRVEVAEIEMALLDLDNIKEAAVIAHEDRPGNQKLVAYFVPAEQPAPNITAIWRALAEILPDYMVPVAFVVVDALPLLPNGKVDRKDLPLPGRSRPELDSPFVAPRTPLERAVAEIWAPVLGLDQVGVHDNFLELGGDSLLASQVISQVIKTFQVEVPLRFLFESPTVADMTVIIVQNQAKNAGQEDINRMLTGLEALPDEEARRLLSVEDQSTIVSDI